MENMKDEKEGTDIEVTVRFGGVSREEERTNADVTRVGVHDANRKHSEAAEGGRKHT